ncbi:MAG: glycosyltransferase family 4 protein [Candidatus Micrarchaeota archaeon]
MESLKIAFLSPLGADTPSSRRIAYFAKYLHEFGHETELIYAFNYSKLAHKFDILHALKLNPKSSLIGWFFKPFFRKLVVDVDDWESLILRERKRNLAAKFVEITEDFLLPRCDGVLAGNEPLRQILIKHGVPEKKILETILNGVELANFNPALSGEEVRSALKLGNSPTAVYIGSLGYFSQLLPTLLAMREIVKEHANAKLLLVGDGAAKPQLEKLARDLKITQNVIFTGRVPHLETPKYVAAAHACLVCSPRIPSLEIAAPGAKAFEYMAMAKPIIASRMGYAPTIFENGAGAYLVEPEPKEIASAFSRIINNQEEARAKGKKAREIVEREYDWKVIAKKVERAYFKVLTQ